MLQAEANFVAGRANNARVTRPEHFDPRSASQPELLEPVYVVGLAFDTKDLGDLAGKKIC